MRHGRRGLIAAIGVVTLSLCQVASAEAWYQPAGGASPINQSPTAQAAQPSLASVDGVPYVAWTEPDGTNSEVRVSKLNAAGTAWTQVGGPINQSPTRDAFDPSLASIGGVPYVAWAESDGTNNEIRVSKLDGGAWTQVVGGASPINQDPSRGADAPSLASIGGVPYVAWSELDGTSFEIRVSKLDGGAWTQLEVGESPINQDSNRAARNPSLASVGGVPYVAWTEHDGTNYEVRVSKFDGGAWTQVGGGVSPINQDPGKDGLLPSLDSVAGVPFVAWSEFDATNSEIRVSKMNGGGTSWTQVVGGASPINASSSRSGIEPSLASIGGVPYVAWSELDDFNSEIRVSKLNDDGTVWLQIADDFLSPVNQDPNRDGTFPSLAVVGDVPHVAWQEFDGTNTEIRVSRDNQGLKFSSAAYSIAEGSSPATITVQRDALAGPVTVDYATSNGTASAPGDYAATSGTLTFADGEASKTFTVPIVNDTNFEANETIQLALSNPGGHATLDSPSSSTLTITDDDTIDTLITSGPDGPTNDPTATFAFAADKPAGATFACSIDLASPTPCTSPVTTPTLADGAHSFTVRASSPTAGTDPSPAVRTFFVDTVAPTTTIAIAPVPGFGTQIGSGQTYAGSVSIGPSMSDPEPSGGGIATRCSFNPASPPATYNDVDPACPLTTNAVGTHTVYAASTDFAGNAGPVASTTFTIVATPETTITSGPSGPTWATVSGFGFDSDLPGSTFQCRVDGGPFVACNSPYLTPTLSSGAHSFEVRAISSEGVVDPTPAHRDFSVRETERISYGCELKPFPRSGSGRDGLVTCRWFTCPVGDTCADEDFKGLRDRRIPEFCPVGAECTLTTTSDWFDADNGVDWRQSNSAEFDDQTRKTLASDRHVCSTGFAGDRCSIRSSVTLLGANDRLTAICGARRDATDHPEYRDDSIRRLECKLTFTASPAPPLRTIAAGSAVQILAPGAGVLGISPLGGHGKRAAAKPAFQPASQTVSDAGPVTFKLKLGKKSKQTLKRKHKLSLKLEVTFTPTGGEAITSTQKVTLSKN
jgi:hypothetical protein